MSFNEKNDCFYDALHHWYEVNGETIKTRDVFRCWFRIHNVCPHLIDEFLDTFYPLDDTMFRKEKK